MVASVPQKPISASPAKTADITLSAPAVRLISTSNPSSSKYPKDKAKYWGA